MASAPLDATLTGTLPLGDAIELAAAWVTHIAADRSIRVLIIKGPGLAHHGLRAPRTSADVDVLVDPARFDDFCAALTEAHWHVRPMTAVGAEWGSHSVTFMRNNWPCDIDAHRHFPGFLADALTAFEALWRDRTTMVLANRRVDIPDRNGSVLVSALHHLRDGASRAAASRELDRLRSVKLTLTELVELADLAAETGATGPVAPVLTAMGLPSALLPPIENSAALREWNSRLAADASGPYFWLLLISRTPLLERPGILLRAIWPPRRDLQINNPGAPDARWARVKLRIARIPKGMRELPRALRALRPARDRTKSTRKVSGR